MPKLQPAQDIVFIALHPPVIMDTLELLKNDVKADATVISLAPKINIAKISSKLGQVKNMARLIPNATSYINEGYNPVSFSAGFDSSGEKGLVLIFWKLLVIHLRWLKKSLKVMQSCLQCYQHTSGSSGDELG